MEHRHFRINDWTIKPELNRLESGGEEIHLEPKIVDVLVYLARHAGRLVSRDELMENVWKDTVVLSDSLNRCISQLRSVFQRDPDASRVIETVRKRGYRLVADVVYTDHDDVIPDTGEPIAVNPQYTVSSTMHSGRFQYV